MFHYNPKRHGEQRSARYHAFAIRRESPDKPARKPKGKRRGRKAPPPKRYLWTRQMPIMARAMVLAGDRLFLAGPPDVFSIDDPVGALEGAQGGALVVLSAAKGQQLAEYPLPSPPVLDGMAAVRGTLYLAMTDGSVLCFRGGG